MFHPSALTPCSLLHRSPLALPIHPTPRILADALPARHLRHPRRRPTPDPRLTIKHHLRIRTRLLKAKPVLELFSWQEQAVWSTVYGHVLGARDTAGLLEFGGLAHVDEEGGGGGVGDEGGDGGEVVGFDVGGGIGLGSCIRRRGF